MSLTRWIRRPAWLVVLATAAVTGCASMKTFVPAVDDVSQKRHERSEAAARRFDRQHDAAEFADAQARYEAGDLRGCAKVVERLLARSPDHLEARLLMAEALLADNRPSDAVTYLETVLAAHPSDARLHHLMGLVLDAMGQRSDALVYYEQATRLQPNDEVYAVSYEVLAAESGETGAGSEETPRKGNASQEDAGAPSSPLRSLHFHLSTPFSPLPSSNSPLAPPQPFVPQGKWNGPVETAGSPEGRSFAGDAVGGSVAELLEQGDSAMAEGTGALAFAYFREAMAASPDDPRVPIAAAVSALRHNQPDVAVALLEPLLKVFPESATIRRILATGYYRLGEYHSSQVVLQQALSLDKSCGLSYFLMGCTLAKLGQLTAAETHFCQARRLDPRYASPR